MVTRKKQETCFCQECAEQTRTLSIIDERCLQLIDGSMYRNKNMYGFELSVCLLNHIFCKSSIHAINAL